MDGSNLADEQSMVGKSGPNMRGSGRKRGHQHHLSQSGTRTSSVRVEEVLAALRRGDHLPVTQPTIEQPSVHLVSGPNNSLTDDNSIDCDSSASTDQNGNRNSTSRDSTRNNTLIDVLNKNSRLGLMSTNAVKSMDSTNERPNEKTNVISRDSDDWAETATSTDTIGALNSSDIDMETISKDDLNDSISSGSSSTSTKTKSKRSKKNDTATTLDADTDAKKKKRSKKTKLLAPTEERPPLEGADADQWTEMDGTVADVENDPEAAEWSKLRCTSERTEVVAEREYRRQNRRCADYPGLAFGRSIFSSDTMMKLNIIRNELHNIMKTQLKRVCVTDDQRTMATRAITQLVCISNLHFMFNINTTLTHKMQHLNAIELRLFYSISFQVQFSNGFLFCFSLRLN